MLGLDGRRVFVTGGASGMGREIARKLRAEGAQVAIGDLPGPQLASADDDGLIGVECDVTDVAGVHAAVGQAVEALGGLDTLVLSAGIIHIKPIAEVAEADWDRLMAVNLRGAFFCIQAAAPTLQASSRGVIVAIGSEAGRTGSPLVHAYAASKAGLHSVVQSAAAELAPGVRVNAVAPVSTPGTGMGRDILNWKTARTGRSDDEVLASVAQTFPLQRACTPADVADVVMFLVSDHASYMTGQIVDVDGGAALHRIPGAQ
ncbi:SDR family oxidoreductase (plasmid) [Rhodococcus sp. USK10]|uniref:SDR family NAD(P)-dependent oxidoreductase n=1 Tax=Rhodococcus sp. USK10 TaxID=2789739 RepID=UPI001C5DB6CE|nr:SDR family NAD(P)-dependent oxidoreductase [Rhodococcus sp. USK10]QYB00187.1 SDR family oxidoreductase [Rhodococcus sp. USK10]